MPERAITSRLQLSGLCFLLQILTIVLFAVFVRYSPESSAELCSQQLNCSQRKLDLGFQHPREYPYPGWVHRPALPGPQALLVGWHRTSPWSVQTCRTVQHWIRLQNKTEEGKQ